MTTKREEMAQALQKVVEAGQRLHFELEDFDYGDSSDEEIKSYLNSEHIQDLQLRFNNLQTEFLDRFSG